jgi:hypothetical protein
VTSLNMFIENDTARSWICERFSDTVRNFPRDAGYFCSGGDPLLSFAVTSQWVAIQCHES